MSIPWRKSKQESIWRKVRPTRFTSCREQDDYGFANFLEGERIKLESTGGGRKEGLAFEREPGYAVYWDINLKPEYRATGTKLKTPPSPTKLGAAYRIEVLEIRKLS